MRYLRIVVLSLLVLAPLPALALEGPTGEQLFKARCTEMCHQTPGAGHLSAGQWKAVMDTMQTRIRQFGLPPLTEEEYQLVLDYLVSRARK